MPRKGTAVAIVACSAVLAACWGLPNESSTRQSIQLNGPGGPGSVSPVTFDFGTVPLGGSQTQSFAFAPLGSDLDDYWLTMEVQNNDVMAFPAAGSPPAPPINGAGSAHVFYATGPDCAVAYMPGSGSPYACTYPFIVTFQPYQSGTTSSSLNFTYQPSIAGSGSVQMIGPPQQFVLTVTGSGSGEQLAANPSPLMINVNTSQGTSASQSISFELKGGSGMGSAPVTATIQNDTAGVFSLQAGPYTATPPPGTSYMLTCTQPGVGGSDFTAQLVLSSTAPGVLGTTVPLQCTIFSSQLVVPQSVTFPNILVGSSESQMFMATYSGATTTVTFTIDGSGVAAGVTGSGGSWVGSSESVSIGTGLPANVTLVWTPTAVAAGQIGTVSATLAGSSSSAPITLYGTASAPDVQTTPPSIDFGTLCAGASAQKPLSVYELGTASVALGSADTPPAGFTASIPAMTLQPAHANDSAGSVTVSPPTSIMTTTTLSGMLTLDVSPGSAAVPVTAIALPAGVSAVPDALDFGEVISTQAAGRSFGLTNCGSGSSALTIQSADITGTDAASFVLAAPNMPVGMMIASTDSLQFTVTMLPGTAGPKSAMLTLTYADSTAPTTVMLTGSDLGAGSDKNRDTYYACATSDGAGAWPVLAALGVCVLAWRRRRA
jgi:hypothetical protein